MKRYKLKNSFIYSYTELWLSKNRERFPVNPVITKTSKTSFVITFENVPSLQVSFRDNSEGWYPVEVWATYDAEPEMESNADILTEFDMSEVEEDGRYYCDLCGPRTYFKNRISLWEDHVLEPLLKWANEKLTEDNYLCFYGEKEWVFEARIKNKIEAEKDKNSKSLLSCRPVIQRS